MVCPGLKVVFDVFIWVVFLAFLPENYVTKGTGFEVFNQTPSRESYLPDYNFYHNLSKLNECIFDLVSRFPTFLDAEMRFRSRWGLSQYVLHFANLSEFENSSWKKTSNKKSRILLSFGEHSSEYLPVESMIYLLKNLTSGIEEPSEAAGSKFTRLVIENIDLYLIGMFNPDGRSVVEKTKNYCWEETGSRANLNFHRFSSKTYNSRQVLVEPECRAITELTSLLDFDVAISLHSGEKRIIIPLRDASVSTISQNPLYPDNREVQLLASHLSTSLPNGLHHKHINQSLIPYGESIFSYITTTRKISFTFLISLWGSNSKHIQPCFAQSNPPSYKLKEITRSLHPLYANLFQYIVAWKKNKLANVDDRQKTMIATKNYYWRSSYGATLFVIIILLMVLMTRIHLPLGMRLFYRRQRRVVSIRSLSTIFTFFAKC